jgi:HSP20 family protein
MSLQPLARRPVALNAVAMPLREMLGYDPFRAFTDSADKIDVVAHETGWTVEIPVPGFCSNDIEIEFKDDLLAIAGKNEKRSFTRSLRLPEEVDVDAIEAHAEHGILTLELRRHPNAEPRRIEVKERKIAS